MKFSKKWLPIESRAGKIIYRPIVEIGFKGIKEKQYRFIIDTGADISVAPRYICDRLFISWDNGELVEMKGISKKKECAVQGRIHFIDIILLDINLNIPICFADGDAPFLIGREGFMDYFDIKFIKRRNETIFELVDKL